MASSAIDVRQTHFPWRRSADQTRPTPARHPVVIVGAGPVGLVAALDLARKGHRSVIIDPRDGLSAGSRAICWAKRTLEIMDRLGVADPLLAKGVTWKTGRLFNGTQEVYAFDLQPEAGHRMPAFINLQQYYFEHYCIEAAKATGLIDLRWQEEVIDVASTTDSVLLGIGTPEGSYRLAADWVIAADGARSSMRRALQLGFEGRVFHDQFLICDITMKMQRPAERWFWFDPPFNPGSSALLHKQADDAWRLDFQIGNEADRDEEMKPDNVARRVRAMLGEDLDFVFNWISIYRFQSRRLERFRHGPILFAGDSAHQMSPFGARGGNSGVQDADNLVWKLDLVLRGAAPTSLLDTYDAERVAAADENLLNTTRSTDFLAPKGTASVVFRDSVLALAGSEPFARRLVNSGRLSVAHCYAGSPLNGRDGFAPGTFAGTQPGAAAVDAPLGDGGWLLGRLGERCTGVWFSRDGRSPEGLNLDGLGVPVATVTDATACTRYGAETDGAFYLFRPDQHIAARWRQPTPAEVADAVQRATGQ